MTISAKDVKNIREITGAGIMNCKKALKDTNGNLEEAIKLLREQGAAKVLKRADKETNEGIIYSYIHNGNKVGVMIELNCETDFVAKNNDFQNLAKEICLQIASMKPKYTNRTEVPQSDIDAEKDILMKEFENDKKPQHILDKIADGKINKYFSEICLEEQIFVKDSSKRIVDIISELSSKVGEKVSLKRFARYEINA